MKQAWHKSGRLRAHILSHSMKQRKPSEAVGQKEHPCFKLYQPIGRRSKRGCNVLYFELGVSVVLQWSKIPPPNHMHERGSGQTFFKIYASMTKTHKIQMLSARALPIGRGVFSLTNLEFSMIQLEKLNKLQKLECTYVGSYRSGQAQGPCDKECPDIYWVPCEETYLAVMFCSKDIFSPAGGSVYRNTLQQPVTQGVVSFFLKYNSESFE